MNDDIIRQKDDQIRQLELQVEILKYQTDEQKEDREQEFAAQLQAKDFEIGRLKQEHQSV